MTDPLTLAINLGASTRRWLTIAILSAMFFLAAALVLAIVGFFDARRGEIDELRRELGRVKWLVDRRRDLQQGGRTDQPAQRPSVAGRSPPGSHPGRSRTHRHQ